MSLVRVQIRWHVTRRFGSRDRSSPLPTFTVQDKKRVSRRAIEKREVREQHLQKLRRSKEREKEIITEEKSPLFAKSPKDLWVQPKEPKYKSPEVPPGQEANFRYRQSPVMRIRDLALGGKAEEALKIFETEVCKYHKDRIDSFTYDQLLLACARAAKWNLSFKVYNDMKKRAIKPNIKTITTLMNCLAAVKYPTPEERIKYTKEKIQYIINEMEKHNLEPNTQSYNVMLKLLGSIPDVSNSLRLINEMHANPKVEVDETTYTQLVSVLGQDNIAGVFTVWDDLKDRGIKPSAHFYHAIMKYCNIHRKPDLALEVSLQMLDEKLKWDHHTVSLLCTSYALMGESSYAGVLLKKVDDFGIKMDPILWNSILRLGTMKAWKLSRGLSGWMADILSAEQLIDEMEKRLLATKACPSTMEKDIMLLKREEIEALLFGSINSALPVHTEKYYNAILKRNRNYKFTDHYRSKYNKLMKRAAEEKE